MPSTVRMALPYPDDTDANDVPADLQALADRLELVINGAFNTVARDALAGAELWAGRVIWNTTTTRLERWDGDSWDPVDSLPVVAFTTAARNALAGEQLWIGRIIRNTSTGQFEWWDGAAWQPLSTPGAARSFLLMGA